MMNQYYAHRFKGGDNPRRIGTIPVGEIVRLSPRDPHIVEAWLPRVYTAAKKVDGKYVDTFMRGGHLAVVRSLRTGQRKTIADHILQHTLGD